MTKIEIINETVEYYKNNLRGLMVVKERENLTPTYFAPDGAMCAVGRCIDPAKKEEFIEALGEVALDWGYKEDEALWRVSFDQVPLCDNYLKEQYKGHDAEFWTSLQMLHDSSSYWEEDEEGNPILSRYGKQQVEYLRRRYSR